MMRIGKLVRQRVRNRVRLQGEAQVWPPVRAQIWQPVDRQVWLGAWNLTLTHIEHLVCQRAGR